MPSSVIRSYSYDPVSEALTITFQSGRRYVYHKVPNALVSEMKRAFSKGEFFNEHIREHYSFDRLPPE
jgi:lysyl-tRNA synthetase class 2